MKKSPDKSRKISSPHGRGLGALKTGDLAIVNWLDACSVDAWEFSEEIDISPVPVVTVGKVFKFDASQIVLAMNHDTVNDAFSCLMAIPSGMIQSVKRLK